MASARDHATAALLEDAAARARRYLGTLDDRGEVAFTIACL